MGWQQQHVRREFAVINTSPSVWYTDLALASYRHPDCGNPPCNTGNSAPPPYSDPALGYPNPDSWVIGSGASLPLGPDGGAAFWDRIWRDAADWGLTTFKLDHAQSNSELVMMRACSHSISTDET